MSPYSAQIQAPTKPLAPLKIQPDSGFARPAQNSRLHDLFAPLKNHQYRFVHLAQNTTGSGSVHPTQNSRQHDLFASLKNRVTQLPPYLFLKGTFKFKGKYRAFFRE